MSKHVFRVIFLVRPAVRVTTPTNLRISGIDLKIDNVWDAEINAPVGLKIKGTVATESMDDAIRLVFNVSNKIVLLISYLSSTGIPQLLLDKIYEVTPGYRKGPCRFYSYERPIPIISQRSFRNQELIKSLEAMTKMADDHFTRIIRALHWYRSGISTEDNFDRFTAFWIGLENLNPLLINHFKVNQDAEKCPTCKRTSTTQLLGVKHLMENVLNISNLWRDTRRTRVWIIHGVHRFDKIAPEVTRLNPMIEDTFGKALGLLLNRDSDEKLEPMMLSSHFDSMTTAVGYIEGSDLSMVDKESEPVLLIKYSRELIVEEDNGVPLKGAKLTISSEPVLADGFKMKITKYGQMAKPYLAERIQEYPDKSK